MDGAKLDKILDKLDTMDTRIDGIDKTLAVNTEQLKEHIRRTEILETKVDTVELDVDVIKLHVDRVENIPKIIMWIVAFLAAVLGLFYKYYS